MGTTDTNERKLFYLEQIHTQHWKWQCVSRTSVCTFTNGFSLLGSVASGSKRIGSFSKSSPRRSWDLGQFQPMLVGIPVCRRAGWEKDLTPVCLWEKILNCDKRLFARGCICKLSGLEGCYRVNFTEAAWGGCQRLSLFLLDLSQYCHQLLTTLDMLCLLPG